MTRKQKFFAAAAALAALFLIGCSNGLVGDATVSGGSSETRSASIYITNFGNTALRTIAPDQLDVNATALTFVATGSSARKDMTPQKVVVTDGRVDLSSLDAGIWTLTITAYDNAKLTNAGVGTDATVDQIIAQRDTCAVLAGSATVDLTRGNGDVNVTLTPKGIGTTGDIDLTVQFNTTDVTTITRGTSGTTYTTTIGLYEKLTLTEVAGTKQTVTPANRVDYDVTSVTKGEYIFMVEVTADDGTGPWSYSDNIYIEGNRATTGTVVLPQLIGTPPTAPENFAIYWDKSKADVASEKYTVQFAWDRKAYNESYYELEIVDITDAYNYTTRIEYNGTSVTSAATLWTAIEADPDYDTMKLVLDKDNFARTSYPIYNNAGNLLAGSTNIEYELQTGHVYAARIRAVNYNGKSVWVHMDITDPASKWTTGTPDVFDTFVFDVYTITYDLSGYMLLKNGETQDAGIINKQFAYAELTPGTPHPIDYPAYTDNNTTGYQLYASSFVGSAAEDSPDRFAAWTGWMTTTSPVVVYDENNNNEYSGYKNLVLIPCGINGAKLEIISAGTYATVLTPTTVLSSIETSNAEPTWAVATHPFELRTQDIAGATLGIGQVGGVYGINMDADGTDPQYLHLTVGAEIDGAYENGKLKDASDRTFSPIKVTYTLKRNGTTFKKEAVGTPSAYLDIKGLDDGDYTLTVEAMTDTSYTFTWQTPVIIKYDDTTL